MGYTISYNLNLKAEIWKTTWPRFIHDANIIIEAADIAVLDDRNAFDIAELGTSPVICDEANGIRLNGVGTQAHEPFILTPSSKGRFCKTNRKPYDTVVCCILLRAFQLAGPAICDVSSDGLWEIEWLPARLLLSQLWPRDKITLPPGMDSAPDLELPNPEIRDTHKKSPRSKHGSLINESVVPLPNNICNDFLSMTESQLLDKNGADLIRSLLSCCHEDCNATAFRWRPDIKKRCIVLAPQSPYFAALSYVWGGSQQPQLNSATEQMLMHDGGLECAEPPLPNVITDAIALCEMVGLDYLWVDALCIMQDSSLDMKLQMLRMRNIYAGAKVTLVAAAGSHANARLVHTKVDSPDRSKCISIEGLAAMISQSTWSSRGWTYQELALSRRAIFFVPDGIYVACQKEAWDVTSKQNSLASRYSNSHLLFNKPMALPYLGPNAQLHSYLHAVEQYSRRSLTYPGDALNAFQGILQTFRSTLDGAENDFQHGLPTCAFDQALCFRTALHDPSCRRKNFPSWSWLGWAQAVTFDHTLIEQARTQNLIIQPRFEYTVKGTSFEFEWDSAGLEDLWRPLREEAIFQEGRDYYQWGFPTALSSSLYEGPAKSGIYSIADLRIASEPLEASTDGLSGSYTVFPVRCERAVPDIGRYGLPRTEMCSYQTEEDRATPSEPADQQTIGEEPWHAQNYHDSHQGCLARTPLGQIWLNKAWRASKPKHCVMGFTVMAGTRREREADDGESDEEYEKRGGGWSITTLMLTERMKRMKRKEFRFCGRERVQMMDACDIDPQLWREVGAEVVWSKLI
ncbi:heterokaryon incompatibility protein-domain-containing protein [Xylariaceae sp. FL1272]|nr:heterokaryon incompatibility protein-domain-containing protein [Xylariaceae sp. FL1272]